MTHQSQENGDYTSEGNADCIVIPNDDIVANVRSSLIHNDHEDTDGFSVTIDEYGNTDIDKELLETGNDDVVLLNVRSNRSQTTSNLIGNSISKRGAKLPLIHSSQFELKVENGLKQEKQSETLKHNDMNTMDTNENVDQVEKHQQQPLIQTVDTAHNGDTRMDQQHVAAAEELHADQSEIEVNNIRDSNLITTELDQNTMPLSPGEDQTSTTSLKSTSLLADAKTTAATTSNDQAQVKAEPHPVLSVTNLSSRTRAADLKQLFNKFSKVVSVKIVTRSKPGPVSKYHGYVTVSTIDGLNNCIKNLDKTELDGRVIGVEQFNSQEKSKVTVARQDMTSTRFVNNTKIKTSDSEKAAKSTDDSKAQSSKTVTLVDLKKKEDTRRPVKARLSVGHVRNSASAVYNRERRPAVVSSKRYMQSSTGYHQYSRTSEHNRQSETYDNDRQQQQSTHQHHQQSSYLRLQEERNRDQIRRKRKLEEEERQRQREKEKLKLLERKQREEATKLAHERERLKLERERLEREKLETERLKLYNERMEHQRLKRELEKQRRLDELRMREDEDFRRRSDQQHHNKRHDSYQEKNHSRGHQHFHQHEPAQNMRTQHHPIQQHHSSGSRQTSSKIHSSLAQQSSSPSPPPPSHIISLPQQQKHADHHMHDIIMLNRDQVSPPPQPDIIESSDDFYQQQPSLLTSSSSSGYVDSNPNKRFTTSAPFNNNSNRRTSETNSRKVERYERRSTNTNDQVNSRYDTSLSITTTNNSRRINTAQNNKNLNSNNGHNNVNSRQIQSNQRHTQSGGRMSPDPIRIDASRDTYRDRSAHDPRQAREWITPSSHNPWQSDMSSGLAHQSQRNDRFNQPQQQQRSNLQQIALNPNQMSQSQAIFSLGPQSSGQSSGNSAGLLPLPSQTRYDPYQIATNQTSRRF